MINYVLATVENDKFQHLSTLPFILGWTSFRSMCLLNNHLYFIADRDLDENLNENASKNFNNDLVKLDFIKDGQWFIDYNINENTWTKQAILKKISSDLFFSERENITILMNWNNYLYCINNDGFLSSLYFDNNQTEYNTTDEASIVSIDPVKYHCDGLISLNDGIFTCPLNGGILLILIGWGWRSADVYFYSLYSPHQLKKMEWTFPDETWSYRDGWKFSLTCLDNINSNVNNNKNCLLLTTKDDIYQLHFEHLPSQVSENEWLKII